MEDKKLNNEQVNNVEETVLFNPINGEPPEKAIIGEKPPAEFPLQPEEVGRFRDEFVSEEYEDDEDYEYDEDDDEYDDEYEDDDEYDDYDDYEEEKIKKKKSSSQNSTQGILIALTVIVVIIFVSSLVWGVNRLSIIFSDTEQEETNVVENEEDEEIIVNETTDDSEKDREKVLYTIVFDTETIEKDGSSYFIEATIDDGKKEKKETLEINKKTQIKEDGKKLNIKSFITILESIGDYEVEFEGKVDESNFEVVVISYKQAQLPEIIEEEEPDKEENKEDYEEEEPEETDNEEGIDFSDVKQDENAEKEAEDNSSKEVSDEKTEESDE